MATRIIPTGHKCTCCHTASPAGIIPRSHGTYCPGAAFPNKYETEVA